MMSVGPAMLDGVVHGLLGDAKQVRGDADVATLDRVVAGEAAGHVAQVLHFGRQARAAPTSDRAAATTGSRPRDSSRVFSIACVHQLRDLGVGRCSGAPVLQLLLQHLAHERHAGEVLAQAVVQILADAPLLAPADIEHGGFEGGAR